MTELATTPFDDANADIALRSAEGVHFRVAKAILVHSSPFFRDMLSLPQPSTSASPSSGNREDFDGIPVVPVSESKLTLDTLLRICYPILSPEVRDLLVIRDVLAAALKYDMELPTFEMRKALQTPELRGSSKALAIFAICHSHKLEEDARRAISDSLKGPFMGTHDPLPFIDRLSGGTYFKLLDYHRQVSSTVVKMFEQCDSLPVVQDAYHCTECQTECEDSHCTPSCRSYDHESALWWRRYLGKAIPIVRVQPLSDEIFSPSFTEPLFVTAKACEECWNEFHAKWTAVETSLKSERDRIVTTVKLNLDDAKEQRLPPYVSLLDTNKWRISMYNVPTYPTAPFDNPEADLIVRSLSGDDFRVMRAILAESSPTFRDKLSSSSPKSSPSSEYAPATPQGPPMMRLALSSKLLDTVLRICYPIPSPEIYDFNAIDEILGASAKYNIEVVASEMTKVLRNSMKIGSAEELPSITLSVYAIAYRHKLWATVHIAARQTLHGPFLQTYEPAMERINAAALHRLIIYRQRVSEKVVNVFSENDNGCKKPRSPPFIDSYVSCRECQPRCCSAHGTPGAARWWQAFRSFAKEKVVDAPLFDIFSPAQMETICAIATSCSTCSKKFQSNWNSTMIALKHERDRLISEVKLDLPSNSTGHS
ncbi:hypothetical protein BD410DRAFT_783851 [Rickenella mellea]|uniref:BTB domain-containing protein n=1 Tax=Rickenella mellea TaxID=50990 RepID=A0A4Y7QIS6_9AGAM|nr:hypothetical protein BD410DRAFT_783851 [Rickenella mellea]